MAKKHILFDQKLGGWDLSTLPAPINTWHPRMTVTESTKAFSEYHDHSISYTNLNAHVTKAILEFLKEDKSEIALIHIGENTYSSEMKNSDGSITIMRLLANGKLAGSIRQLSGRYESVKTLGDSKYDASPIMLMALMMVLDKSPNTKAVFDEFVTEYKATGEYNKELLFCLSNAVYYAVAENKVKVTLSGGNMDFLPQQTVELGALNGTVICGVPEFVNSAVNISSSNETITFADAKKNFSEWAKQFSWTKEEEALIPKFDDKHPVPKEAIKIAKFYIATHEDKNPMLNFLWRGITSYGKSTGVELMAGFLNMPLLRMTCNSSMETQQFLSDFVPDNGLTNVTSELPSFSEMAYDPETAYFKLTGTENENATSDMCLEEYSKAILARSGECSGARFKHVESNFVKALSKGYIVEIQEISRIKDSGVLVGLNEYDRPGANIPLVDGSFVKRHPNAMVVYTDNVGYVSCRPVDPSVIRRMSFVMDSYEIPKKDAIDRVIYNTGFKDKKLLNKMYDVWCEIAKFCKDRDITEGAISLTELERWAQSVKVDEYTNVFEHCANCVVSKATSVIDEQQEIMSSVVSIHLQ